MCIVHEDKSENDDFKIKHAKAIMLFVLENCCEYHEYVSKCCWFSIKYSFSTKKTTTTTTNHYFIWDLF